MKRELRDTWVKDLEQNGDLKLTGQLSYEGTYCALGRACVISGIKIDPRGLECLNEMNERDRFNPLERIGINTEEIINLNDRSPHRFDRYKAVIDYLKKQPVED